MTSHKSQGQTFDKVMVHHNTNAGHGDRETYVNVTRAREDVKYYTQDSNKAAKQAGEKLDKESATGSSKSSMW
jgi:ATP-dependent exoDNAse (exonuclease V) alpha subunit